MARTSVDRVWFGIALVLLGYGMAAWWADVPGPEPWAQPRSMLAVWLSAGALLVGWWRWSSVGHSANSWAAAPLTLAVTAPLSMVPLVDFADTRSSLAGLLFAGLAVVPLAVRIAQRVVAPQARRRTMIAVVALAVVGVTGSWLVGRGDIEPFTRALRWAAAAATTLVPAAVVAWELIGGPQRTPLAAQRRSLSTLLVLAVGTMPAVAALALTVRGWPILLIPVAGPRGGPPPPGRGGGGGPPSWVASRCCPSLASQRTPPDNGTAWWRQRNQNASGSRWRSTTVPSRT